MCRRVALRSSLRIALALLIGLALLQVPWVAILVTAMGQNQGRGPRTPPPRTGKPEGTFPNLDDVKSESHLEREALPPTLVLFPIRFQHGIGWRGIVPLKSTRAEVERELGPLDLRCQCYETDKELIRVAYAKDRCMGDLPGCNVPRDTVLSLTVLPHRQVAFSEIEPRKAEFVKTTDDTFTAYYGNGDQGLRYAVSEAGFITAVSYFPSVKDNGQRCAGFPPSDGGITAYSPYDEFPYESLEDITSRIGEFTIRLQKLPSYKGYIVVYAGRGQETRGLATLANKARDYVIEELETDPKAIVAINGGYREEPRVQLFLIPSSWPPPAANPTLAGALK